MIIMEDIRSTVYPKIRITDIEVCIPFDIIEKTKLDEDDSPMYSYSERIYEKNEYIVMMNKLDMEQQHEINLNMEATVEIYEMIEVRSRSIQNPINSSIGNIYSILVKRGRRKIEEVPVELQEYVTSTLSIESK